MINLTPNWTDLEKFTTTNLNFKKLQLCQNRLLDFFASFSPFKIGQFVLNMEWTVTQKTLKHLHNIGQEYLGCLHHMIASNQQNFPLLCCSGCANSTNVCLGILGFGYYIMHSKLKCQSSTNSQEKTHLQKHLTCQDPAPWKTIHTPQVLLVHAHKGSPISVEGCPYSLKAWTWVRALDTWQKRNNVSIVAVMVYNTCNVKCGNMMFRVIYTWMDPNQNPSQAYKKRHFRGMPVVVTNPHS